MIEVRKQLVVSAGADALYAYLVVPDNIVDYVGPIRRIRPASAGEVGAGSRLWVDVSFLGIRFTQPVECTVHQPPERFECRSVGGRFTFTAGFTLQPTALGTRLDGWGDASAPSLFRFAEPVVQFFIERQVDQDFVRLKRVLEAEVR